MNASPPPLPDYAAAVAELVLSLRDEAHLLSSIDQHLVATWWSEGYPLETVLRTVHDGGRRLLARKRPPRGLPLQALAKLVEKAGRAARGRHAAGANRDPGENEDAGLIAVAMRTVEAALREEPTATARAAALREALRALSSDDAATAAPFATLVSVARSYYNARLGALTTAERAALCRRVLGDGVVGADASAVDELLRRALRHDDPLLDIDHLLGESSR